jgi:signal transduction histidine kinase/DNA-binding NarL/FixJ family response regulator
LALENTKVQKLFFYSMLFIMAVSVAVPILRLFSSKAPVAVNGVLDLTHWNAEKDGAVRLNGEWEFYFGRLLSPDDFKGHFPAGGTLQKVPSKWSLYKIGGKRLSPYGTATYRLKIRLPAEGGNYGIKITCVSAAARIFADGEQVLSCGNPAASAEATEQRYYADTAYFHADGEETELVVQVANYANSASGICYEIYFGSQQAVNRLRMYYFFIDAALISGMFFISLYFFGLGLQRKNNLDVLFFAAYCLFSAIHSSTSSESILNYAFPALGYHAAAKILTFSLILSLYSLVKYVSHAFRAFFDRRIDRIVDGIALFFLLLTCFTRFYLWGSSVLVFTLGNIWAILLVLWIITRHIHANVEGRYYLYTAIVSSVFLLVTGLFNIELQMESNLFVPVFQPILVLSLAFYMSGKYESSCKTIEQLSAQLSALDRLKDDFLARTSHELKTPLNGMINIAQSLLDGAGGGVNPAQAEDLRLVASIGRRLSTLVYDILDYSKWKVMGIRLKTSVVDVQQVVESTMEIFRYLIKGKPLVLENRIPRGTYLILADENRLRQIVSNLLDNSIKFTASGTITVDCRTDGDFLFIRVRDTGVGIPADKLKDIFLPYEQFEALPAAELGTGLGLAITRQLVELHGGQISAESEPGKGSCFTFSMPLEKSIAPAGAPADVLATPLPNHAAVPAESLPYTADVGGEFSILVADDEYSNLKALLNVLTLCKYNVTIAGSAESALQLLKGPLKYDLCILDVMMPGMSGYEACRKIRETYSPLELPVLLLTAKALPGDLEAGFGAGANDFIEKPFETGELKCRVLTLVQLKNSMDLLLEKETAFLQAQIRPHFLFNALNTIGSFCYTAPTKAGELLSELGVFLRSSFDFSSTSSFIPVDKELRLVKAYVAIEQARFGKQLEVAYDIDPCVLKYNILPLMIQPIVENSIRHGLMKRTGGGKVTLRMAFCEGRMNIRVTDNGIGIPGPVLEGLKASEAKSGGVGLNNINRRLSSFYGTALDISSVEGCGTAVSFSIPV